MLESSFTPTYRRALDAPLARVAGADADAVQAHERFVQRRWRPSHPTRARSLPAERRPCHLCPAWPPTAGLTPVYTSRMLPTPSSQQVIQQRSHHALGGKAAAVDTGVVWESVMRSASKHAPEEPLAYASDGFPIEEVLGTLNEFERAHAPKVLYLRGDRQLLTMRPKVSVVGSREASEEGIRRTSKLARQLAEAGVVVVSGLARGIDSVAHRAAMECGHTIGVLGTPLDQVYPRENASLQAAIGRDHLLCTQFAAGMAVQRSNFPRRNRTMALIVDASVIVEAGDSSGTLSQGWEALRLGRPLFLMKSVVERPGLSWPAEMIGYGARVLTNVEDVLERLPFGDPLAALSA